MDPKFLAQLRPMIAEAEKRAKAARDFIQKATAAGIDVKEAEKDLAAIELKIRRMKAEFLPGG